LGGLALRRGLYLDFGDFKADREAVRPTGFQAQLDRFAAVSKGFLLRPAL